MHCHLEPGKTTYVPAVRIGNWLEETVLDAEKVKDFLAKKDAGELLIQKTSSLREQVTAPVELSSDRDSVAFGDKVVLFHVPTERSLSAHIPLDVLHLSKAIKSPCPVTASTNASPCIRNTFIIQGMSPDISGGDFVRFGQPFYLTTQPGAGGELYLHSDAASFRKDAKYSRQQEVLLVDKPSYFCAWQILSVRQRDRLESEGEPVPSNSVIVLNHCKTNQNLACLSQFSYKTGFGLEHEVTAHTHYTQFKTIDMQNHWMVMNRIPRPVIEETSETPNTKK